MDYNELVRKLRKEALYIRTHGIDCWADGYLLAAEAIEELLKEIEKSNKINKTNDNSYLDVVDIVKYCCDKDTSYIDTECKLSGVIKKAKEDLDKLDNEESYEYIKKLERIVRGLRNSLECCDRVKAYYFGQFQERVEQLKQSVMLNIYDDEVERIMKDDYAIKILGYLYGNIIGYSKHISECLELSETNVLNKLHEFEDIDFVKPLFFSEGIVYILTPKGNIYYYEQCKILD